MLLVINAVWGRRNLALVCIHCIDLHSFDECMERVLCWSWTNSAYVYIAWMWHVLLVIDAVWGRNLTFTRCSNTLCTIITAVRWSSFVGWIMARVSCWCWTISKYVCIATCVGTCYWCSMYAVCGRNHLTLTCCPPEYTTMAMHDNYALIFVCWMYGTGVVLALDEQAVRLYCCMCATIWHVLLVFDATWSRNLILVLYCPNTLK